MNVQGKNVILYAFEGGVWIGYACGRNITFNVSTDFIETSSSGTGKNATFLPTKNNFTATIDGIVALEETDMLTLTELRQKQLAHELLLLRFQRTDDGAHVYTDECSMYISNSSDVGNFDDMNVFTIDLRGTGVITQIFVTQPPIPIDAIQVKRFEFTASGGETGFTEALLVNKEILEVNKDGIGYSPIITSGTPVNKEVKYTVGTGAVLFPGEFEAGEQIYVLYQDL